MIKKLLLAAVIAQGAVDLHKVLLHKSDQNNIFYLLTIAKNIHCSNKKLITLPDLATMLYLTMSPCYLQRHCRFSNLTKFGACSELIIKAFINNIPTNNNLNDSR